MYRRALLGGLAGAGTIAATGCLGQLETRSVWDAPPQVEDPPDAVYVPSSIEGMQTYGTELVDDVAVGLFATVPHRFWVVTGDSRERVDVEQEDAMHLMASVWDPETGLVPPAEIAVELRGDGKQPSTPVQLWPMLAQRMGFHYGDNVKLSGAGEYEVTLRVSPTSADATGAVAGRFDEAIETTISFSFEPGAIFDLDLVTLDQRHWGQRGAVPLMIDRTDLSAAASALRTDRNGGDDESQRTGTDSGGSVGDDGGQDPKRTPGPPLPLRAPSIDELPGRPFKTGTTGDATVVVTRTDESPADGESGSYLAVSPRTPYNRLGLPFASLSITPAGTESPGDERTRLTERLDDRFGHHYGAPIDTQPGDELTLRVDSPPQLARHGGYETAFFEMEAVTFTLPT